MAFKILFKLKKTALVFKKRPQQMVLLYPNYPRDCVSDASSVV